MATRVVFNRKASALVDQRDEPRQRIECMATTALGEDGAPFVATVQDISIFGCRLGGAGALEVGSRVWMRLADAAPVLATVVWSRDGEAGCRFATPIGQGLMRSLLPGAI